MRKKVLLGVRLGGSTSFKGWQESTYFEFDPNPVKSERFTVTRAVDHPFKDAASAEGNKKDPDHLILAFDIKRSGVRVNCTNCEHRPLSQEELAKAKLAELQNGKSCESPKVICLGSERPVWLPPHQSISAPHLVVDSSKRQFLVWLNRMDTEHSMSCIAVTDPRYLLTHTRLENRGCTKNSNLRIKLGTQDLYSASPQVMTVENEKSSNARHEIRAAAITAQRPAITAQRKEHKECKKSQLQVCNSQNASKGIPGGQKSECTCLLLGENKPINDFGVFQSFPVVRSDQHIYLWRRLTEDRIWLQRFIDWLRRKKEKLQVLVFDHALSSNLILARRHEIDAGDEFDPMMPISKNKNSMIFVSMRAINKKLQFFETDLKRNGSKPQSIPLEWNKGNETMKLHESWARRPVHIVEHDSGRDSVKTQFILSRSEVCSGDAARVRCETGQHLKSDRSINVSQSTGKKENADTVLFEFLVLERYQSNDNSGSRLKSAWGAQCAIRYDIQRLKKEYEKLQKKFEAEDLSWSSACKQASEGQDDDRPTPATKIQGAQLLVGRFGSRVESPQNLDLALHDHCAPGRRAIVFAASSTNSVQGVSPTPELEGRKIRCEQIGNHESIEGEIKVLSGLKGLIQ